MNYGLDGHDVIETSMLDNGVLLLSRTSSVSPSKVQLRRLQWKVQKRLYCTTRGVVSVICGVLSYSCKTNFAVLYEKVNQWTFRGTLKTTPHNCRRAFFAITSARRHRARSIKRYIEEGGGITNLPWLAMNPYMNPKDHIWDHMNKQLRCLVNYFSTLRQSEIARSNIWHSIRQQPHWQYHPWSCRPYQWMWRSYPTLSVSVCRSRWYVN